jgi:hypothetical protein
LTSIRASAGYDARALFTFICTWLCISCNQIERSGRVTYRAPPVRFAKPTRSRQCRSNTAVPRRAYLSYAIKPLQADLLPWSQEVPDHSKNELSLKPGKPIAEVLELAIDWLPED